MSDRKTITEKVEQLNRSFAYTLQKAKKRLGQDNTKGTAIHKYQVDFCYLIDSIQREPSFSAPPLIQEAKELIEKLDNEY